MRKLNKEQAWQVIALIYSDRPRGICNAINRLYGKGLISRQLRHELAQRMNGPRPAGAQPKYCAYWWDLGATVAPDYNRVSFALSEAGRATTKKKKKTRK